MKEQDIEQLLAAEQRRRQAADRDHLRQLAQEQGADLGRWCAHRRMVVRTVALVLLVAVPAVYAALLPQRDPASVLCNQRGDELLVIDRACSALGNCEDRPVSLLLQNMEDN